MTSQNHAAGDMGQMLSAFAGANLPLHDGSEERDPKPIRLNAYPAELIEQVLADDVAHPLLTMAHIDGKGFPFTSVMGFSFIDGKIHICSRATAFKNKRLAENPKCSMIYHNNIPRPTKLGCISLVGNVRLSTDKELIHRANVALSHKTFRDTDPDVDQRDPMIESMDAADRIVIVLEEVIGVYIISPMLPNLPAGIPTPVISWRADW